MCLSLSALLMALISLSKQGDKKRNWAIALGSIIPDAAIYLWAPYQRFVKGVSGETMWRELYFAEPMQNLIAYFNSIPIYGALAVLGYVMRAKTWGTGAIFRLSLIMKASIMPVGSALLKPPSPLFQFSFSGDAFLSVG